MWSWRSKGTSGPLEEGGQGCPLLHKKHKRGCIFFQCSTCFMQATYEVIFVFSGLKNTLKIVKRGFFITKLNIQA